VTFGRRGEWACPTQGPLSPAIVHVQVAFASPSAMDARGKAGGKTLDYAKQRLRKEQRREKGSARRHDTNDGNQRWGWGEWTGGGIGAKGAKKLTRTPRWVGGRHRLCFGIYEC
jgi:hypothetical protein